MKEIKSQCNLTGDIEILRPLHFPKRNIKTKTKILFLPIRPDQMGRSARLRKCDQNSLSSRARGRPKDFWFFMYSKRVSFLCFCCCYVSRQNSGVLSMSLLLLFLYLKDQHTTGRRAVTRKRQKPALAFENVDFVDDVVIFVIVRINETRKVLYVKVRPRYYINK